MNETFDKNIVSDISNIEYRKNINNTYAPAHVDISVSLSVRTVLLIQYFGAFAL